MAPVRSKKRVSDPSTAAKRAARLDAIATPAKTDKPASQSPAKRSRVGITLAQKQALIENLQLELTERARRLRSQYNLQAQGLRSRVEIRVNRIPMALRRLKMGDLIAKHMADQQRRIASASKPPPVPAKDYPPLRAASPQKTLFGPLLPSAAAPRPVKRKSDHIAQEKENVTTLDNPKKKTRTSPDEPPVDQATILSPTSSNPRNVPWTHEQKPLPPPKPQASRPASPVKAATLPASGRAANMVPNPVEKDKTTRTVTASRKPDLPPSSTGVNSSTTGYTAPRTTVRKATAPVPAPIQPPLRHASSRESKRVSDSSDGSSNGAGDRKHTASRAGTAVPAPTTKRTVMGTIRKGVAGAAAVKKASVAKASTTSTGRVLRRRG